MEKVVGYKRLICPNCVPGNKNNKRKATYRVYETNNNYILICVKCGTKYFINKQKPGKETPKQVKVNIK